jgi:allantoate deiminase
MSVDKVIGRLKELGGISDSSECLRRSFLSPANRRAAERILSWMAELGMETGHAVDGTIRGILPGTNPDASPLLLGSHFDTVNDAGIYDGPLGIVSALAALDGLTPLPFSVHVLGFADEEGLRFQTTYLGSKSIVGTLDDSTQAMRDEAGKSIAEILKEEGWHEDAITIHYLPGSVRGYVELHIEQGRVLEELGEPVAAVSGIAGQTRATVVVTGQADHAGTTPMPLRRDALAGAAECILVSESLACENIPSVITVGKISVHPGASNSIPQRAEFTVDLRHPGDVQRQLLTDQLFQKFAEVAQRRNLEITWHVAQESPATPCDRELTERLLNALKATTGFRETLVSGAGHDGVALTSTMPIGMLFVRSRDGLSHHPDEYSSPEDIEKGIEVLTRFLTDFPA